MYDKISGFSDEIDSAIDVQFSVLNKLHISYFEPRGIDGKNISALSEKDALDLKAKMDQYGINASSIGSPIGKIKLEEPFEPHFELFKNVVKTAKILGARYIRIFSFFHKGGANWTQSEREEVLARLRKLIAYAAEKDVVLLHENEKDVYGDTIERCTDLMEELCCKHFKAVFDPANFVQCGQDTKQAYEVLKNYIAYMHIKDACAEDGRVVPAGSGDGNVEYILARLFEAGYQGYISLEPHLGTFDGLADLELDDKMLNLPKGGEGTYTLAYQALCKILKHVTAEIPELLISLSGQKINTVEKWEKFRRKEIKNLFEQYVYGVRDIEKPENMKFSVKHERVYPDSGIRQKDIRIRFDNFMFSFSIYLPAENTKPLPAFLMVMHENMENHSEFDRKSGNIYFSGETFKDYLIPVKNIIERGFCLVVMPTKEIYHDWRAYEDFQQGIFAAVQTTKGRQKNSWATISAWAWGTSRVMDYLETEEEVDEKNVAVIGHSRSGKTALWAAATDTRFKLVVSNNSGCMGAAILRGKDGEHAKEINVSDWFCENFQDYNEFEEMLPVDQHMLLALIAPRYVYVTSSQDDLWADPKAEYLSCKLASDAFELYGIDGFVSSEDEPPLEVPLQKGHIAYHMKPGDHSIKEYDWSRFMDYFDKIKGEDSL